MARGELRHQFHHVIDLAPTILEATGLPAPSILNGIHQAPLEGTSMMYSFDDARAPERHETQYFEMVCNRGIYRRGWTAVAKHRAPWESGPSQAIEDDVWELYAPDDWTQSHDISAENPQKLYELQRLWLMEAARFNVLPLDDRFVERNDAQLAGRPQITRGTSQLLFGGMGRLNEWTILSTKNKSHSITTELVVPAGGAEGVIVAQGGRFGGWAIYAKEGRLVYDYNYFGIEHFRVEAREPIPTGSHLIRMEFDYDGGGVGKGGTISLYSDGSKIATGRVERSVPVAFSIDETCDVGMESGSPVSADYSSRGNRFSGEVSWVRIDTRGIDDDRLVPAEARFQAAMVHQ